MRKNLPWIVVLLTFSLVGIIFIQYNWIKNAVNLRERQYGEKMIVALDNIREELIEDDHFKDSIRLLQSRGKFRANFFKDFSLSAIIPVQMRYSKEEISNIIKINLAEQKLNIPFEFAVLNVFPYNVAQLEIYSDGYYSAFKDSSHHKQFKTPLIDKNSGFNEMMGARFEMLNIIVPTEHYITNILNSIKWIIGGSLLFTFIIILTFILTLSVMLKQRKLAEMKSDFVNNMTHELKTPLATISLAVDAIGNKKVLEKKEKITYFTDIIKAENKRMLRQIETILQSALLDKEEIKLNMVKVDLHEIIQKVIRTMELQVLNKDGVLKTDLQARDTEIMADKVHISNVISNLLDNALKYSKNEDVVIKIETHSTKNEIIMRISDNGIGMNKQTLAHIFDRFYRAHTGNLHDVKGFGLGLTYVKTVITEHHGKIKVDSIEGEGTKFEIELPLIKKENEAAL